MRPLTEAWVAAWRLRRRIGKPSKEAWEASRQGWIREHAPGRSFIDIGGQLFLLGGRAFAAEEAGASNVTLLDAGDPFAEWYTERDRRGSRVRFVQGDVHDPVTVDRAGPHDIVWCTGVIYHSPDPFGLLEQLRRITRSYLFLGSHTIPEVPGIPQACLFYPYLAEEAREPLTRPHWGGAKEAWAVGTPFVETPMLGHGNFWWGITPSALRAMLRAARFEVVGELRTHHWPWYCDIIARPIERDPVLPPISYYRERGEARERGEEIPPMEEYFQRQRAADASEPAR